MDEAKIKELFTEKEALLREMLKLTEGICSALEAEEDAKVLEALEQRGELIKKVDTIDGEIADESRGIIPEVLAEQVARHKELVQALLKMDGDHRKKASELREKYAEEILKLKKTGAAMQSYGFVERPSRGGAFIDTKE